MPNVGPLEFLVILMIAAMFVIPVAVIAVFLRSNTRAATSERDPAVDLLRRRLATGEIDEAEYQRLRSALQGR